MSASSTLDPVPADRGAAGSSRPRATVIRMNAAAMGIVIGLLCGIGLFAATNYLVIKGGDVVGPHLALLGQVFIGYKVTFFGSLIGFAYASVVGFVAGYAGSRLYNWVAGWESKRA
jgi:hypothetical protein